MKSKVFTFILIALLVLVAVPVRNLAFGDIPKNKKQFDQSVLYNFDFLLSVPSRVLYAFGISSDPDQCIIGKNGWLYLGDQYESIVSDRLRPMTEEDQAIAQRIGHATQLWDQWFKQKGVKVFRVMLAPNKETIYPENIPDWSKAVTPSLTDHLLQNVEPIYIDMRPVLMTAKTTLAEPLYYKTDTHWNSLGAWMAFRHFTSELNRTEKCVWLTDADVQITKVSPRAGGDLAKILRLTDVLPDTEVEMTINVNGHQAADVTQTDFDSGKLISTGGNPKISSFFGYTILVKSKNALNQKKVLWLCDSFATSLAPFMAATFSDMLLIHYNQAGSKRIVQLVEAYKPDYVFMTVVERSSRESTFENLPPE